MGVQTRKKQIEFQVSNIKKYSTVGVVWKGERIPIDPENRTGNVIDGFSCFHPITDREYPCITTGKAPPRAKESYVQTIYSIVDGEVKVTYKAYLFNVPSYYYEYVGLG